MKKNEGENHMRKKKMGRKGEEGAGEAKTFGNALRPAFILQVTKTEGRRDDFKGRLLKKHRRRVFRKALKLFPRQKNPGPKNRS